MDKSTICPSCGATTSTETGICEYCGSSLPGFEENIRKTPFAKPNGHNEGKEQENLSDDDRNAKEPFEKTSSIESTLSEPSVHPGRVKKNVWGWILRVIAVVVLISGLVVYLCQRTPSISSLHNWGDISNGHLAVDLGLPSGLNWASCNVGASSEEQFGSYFAWGETSPKKIYDKSTYKKPDFKDKLKKSDDAASVNWGGNWRMPTKEEWRELLGGCKWRWVKYKGVYGCRVKGPNGNSIFLPAAGVRRGDRLANVGSYSGNYWVNESVTVREDAFCVHFSNSFLIGLQTDNGYYGLSVRPVTE